MKQIVILGNSGAARECYWLVREVMRQHGDLRFKGFLSFEGYPDNLAELADSAIGVDDSYRPEANDLFVIGVGLPALRQKAYRKWRDRGIRFFSLIHPEVQVPNSTDIGVANVITRVCSISCNSSLGEANFLNIGTTIGHDVTIGEANFFAPHVCILGECRINSRNSFGCRSVLLPHANVGSGNVIAPGAILYKGCKNDQVLAGAPALVAGRVTPDLFQPEV